MRCDIATLPMSTNWSKRFPTTSLTLMEDEAPLYAEIQRPMCLKKKKKKNEKPKKKLDSHKSGTWILLIGCVFFVLSTCGT